VKLYAGERTVLEDVLLAGGGRLLDDFKPIPQSARWVTRRAMEGLMPSLEDDDQVYLLLPTSATLAAERHVLALPNPDARSPAASSYMTKDVWFEDCGDGGVYIIGMGDDVLIMYVDSPGDSILCRYKCSKKRWEDLWVVAFGAVEIKEPLTLAP